MKTPVSFRSVQAVALVLVLGFLVIISAITIAFFTSVTTLSGTSRTYAAGVSTNMLASTAVQMVISQIRNATTPNSVNSRPCWTSQPGMIRVFGSGNFGQDLTASSTPAAYFKLYSSDNMVLTGSQATTFTTNSMPNEYAGYIGSGGQPDPNQRSVFTDLNAPVLVADPNGLISVTSGGATMKYRADYPVIDPGAQGYSATGGAGTVGQVEGFWLNNGNNFGPGFSGQLPPAATYNPISPGTGNPAPMPVKWLYVLRNGAVVAPSSVDAKGVAQFTDPGTGNASASAQGTVPTAANPIVGRIAFWTDDETCKLNINTASEPTFWDTPMASSNYEAQFGVTQPTANEYQRYPGHPFTVALSPVLGRLFGTTPPTLSTAPYPLAYELLQNPAVATTKNYYYELIPRVSQLNSSGSLGGSQSGTVATQTSSTILADGDRLYTSVDEMLFSPGAMGGAGARATNPAPTSIPAPAPANAVTSSLLQKAKFFLTAYNRSPELNLFGQPRVSIWPIAYTTQLPGQISNPSNIRTTKDKEFVFCSTIGASTSPYGSGQYQFFFQRQPATSTLGTGSGSLSSTADYVGITRNQQLYQYLQYLTGGLSNGGLSAGPIPGFGGSTFLTKYPAPATGASDRDQILTEIFDYVRCTNLSDSSLENAAIPQTYFPYTPAYGNGGAGADNSGQVVPIQINSTSPAQSVTAPTTRGFGRFPTISEAAILFVQKDNNTAPAQNHMQAIMVLESFCPSYGYTILKDTYTVGVDFRSGSMIAATTSASPTPVPLFQPLSYNIVRVDPWHGWLGRGMAGFLGFCHTLWYCTATYPSANIGGNLKAKTLATAGNTTLGGLSEAIYPFVSPDIGIPVPATKGATFTISGGTFNVVVYAGANPAATDLVQTITMQFPAATIPYPTYGGAGAFQNRVNAAAPQAGSGGNADAFIAADINGAYSTTPGLNYPDSARSVEAITDLRLIAGRWNVNAASGFFGPCAPPYWVAGNSMAHSLHTSNGQRHAGAVPAGLLAANTGNLRFDRGSPYGPFAPEGDPRTADVPFENAAGVKVNGVTMSSNYHQKNGAVIPGDFDTGVAKYIDGPFINKADEGNINTTSAPYFTGSGFQDVNATYFSPNRILCSPGWFGSLPTGVIRGLPYQTLLFRPDGANRTNHPGSGTSTNTFQTVSNPPPDHLIMDLFDMPVVEPYPISEPFSTAGKINMNYQIVPFGKYMRRQTAMRGLLRSEKMELIPFGATNGAHSETYTDDGTNYRYDIDESTTLAFLEQHWNPTLYPNPQDQVFRSATQICDLDLYPKPNVGSPNALIPVGGFTSNDASQTYPTAAQTTVDTAWNNFWTQYRLTGDNVRERPYARLYSRLTTKSNTFTVHMRVQTLQKRQNDVNQNTWDENKDQVTGEYRGSALIERYLDPADRRFNPNDPTTVAQKDGINPDHYYHLNGQGPGSSGPYQVGKDFVEAAYKYRIVSTKQFGF